MASSIINSDDGSVSGTTGLKTTGGDDGVLEIQSIGATALTVSTAKDITAAEEFTAKSYNETYAAVTSSSGALTIDCEAGNNFSLSLSENVTSSSFSNPPSTGTAYGFVLKVVQDSTARTITWPASVDWPAATAPTLSSGSGEVDVFVFYTHDGGTTWYGFVSGQDLS